MHPLPGWSLQEIRDRKLDSNEIEDNWPKLASIADFTTWEAHIPKRPSIWLMDRIMAIIMKVVARLRGMDHESQGMEIAYLCKKGILHTTILSCFEPRIIEYTIQNLSMIDHNKILPKLAYTTAAITSEPARATVKKIIQQVFFSQQGEASDEIIFPSIFGKYTKYFPSQFGIPVSLLLHIRSQFPEPGDRKQGFHDLGALDLDLNNSALSAATQAINYYMDDYVDIQKTIQFLRTLEEVNDLLNNLTPFKLLYLLEALKETDTLFASIKNAITHKCSVGKEKLLIAYLIEYQNDAEFGKNYCHILQHLLKHDR